MRHWPRLNMLARIILFCLTFSAALILQTGISRYQSAYVFAPMEQQTKSIQAISEFLNDVEGCITALENYRWDYGDTNALITSLQQGLLASEAHLSLIEKRIGLVSEEQYLLANASDTTYHTFHETLEAINQNLLADNSDEAASLYYDKAERCGTYLRQYTQQLLERAIVDNQDVYARLSSLNATINRIQAVMLVFCVLLGSALIFSLFRLLRVIAQMSISARDISSGLFDTADVDERRQDEIGHLARTFNEMKRSMKRQMQLLEEKNEVERKLHRKETEALEYQTLMEREKLQQLRSQINPHFLFNTLNVIQYTSQQEGAARTHSLIGSLSRLFRYALGSNDGEVPLAKEVNIVDEVYALYHVRFGDRIGMRWHISPEIDLPETMVPSFMLQPLVENAFKHGLARKEDGGCVDIFIEKEGGVLTIRVSDDGVGMSREALNSLRRNLRNPPTTGDHIGVYNVAARLRLRGSEYGMDIESEQGKGTLASLRMPLITLGNEDGEDDAQGADC